MSQVGGPMASQFAVYFVKAKPGLGGNRRAYVGAMEVSKWGNTPKEALAGRVNCHMAHGSGSAAWLRTYKDPEPSSGILATCSSLEDALALELYYTIDTMRSHGHYLTRGGPFCRIEVAWEDFNTAAAGAVGTAEAYLAWLKDNRATLSRDVLLHLKGLCYNCGAKHLVSECDRNLAPALTPKEVRAKFATHFAPTQKAVYFITEPARGRIRWSYQFKNSKGQRRRYVEIKQISDAWVVWHEGAVLYGPYGTDLPAIHMAALVACEKCNVEATRCKRPAGVSTEHGQKIKRPRRDGAERR